MKSRSQWTDLPRTLLGRQSTAVVAVAVVLGKCWSSSSCGLWLLLPPLATATPHGTRRYNNNNIVYEQSDETFNPPKSDDDSSDVTTGGAELYENTGWTADLVDSLSEGVLHLDDDDYEERFLYYDSHQESNSDSTSEQRFVSYEEDAWWCSDQDEEQHGEPDVISAKDDDTARTATTTTTTKRGTTRRRPPDSFPRPPKSIPAASIHKKPTPSGAASAAIPSSVSSKPASLQPPVNRTKADHAPTTPVPPSQQVTAPADPSTSTSSGMSPWVRHYLSTRPSLLVVPTDFMQDNFNLVHLTNILESWVQVSPQTRGIQFPTGGWLYQQALQRILGTHGRSNSSSNNNTTATAETTHNDQDAGVVNDIVDWAAALLYQLIHQRYAISPRGLEAIRRRFMVWHYHHQSTSRTKQNSASRPTTTPQQSSSPPYGRCPRASCRGYALVPIGPDSPLSEEEINNVHGHDRRPCRYCGLCQATWRIDTAAGDEGCAWGTTVGPLFHLIYPQFLEGTQFWDPTGGGSAAGVVSANNEPRIFGFRLWKG